MSRYKNRVLGVLGFLLLGHQVAVAQDDSSEGSNIQTYTPSKLLAKGQWDIKFFNGLYTQTKGADQDGNVSDIPRETYFTNTNEIYTGLSENSRINIGLVFQIRSNILGGSALDALRFGNNDTDARSALTTLAPSIRVQPFAAIGNFSFTSSFYIPVFKDKPHPVYLDKRSFVWETKFFFDHTFGANKWQVFTEADFAYNFGEAAMDADSTVENTVERFANNSLFLPLSVFLSYFPTGNSTIFINTQQAFLIDLGNEFTQNYTQLGIGGKYQITPVLNLELSYGRFVRGNSTGIGETFSLGLRALL